MAASSIMAWLWPNAWLVIPLACVTAVMCRWSVLRAETRHVLWVVVLASFLMPPFLPHPPAAAVARWLQPEPAPSTQPDAEPVAKVAEASGEPSDALIAAPSRESDATTAPRCTVSPIAEPEDASTVPLSAGATPRNTPASATQAVYERPMPVAAGTVAECDFNRTAAKPVAEESAMRAEYGVEPCEPLQPSCIPPTPCVSGQDAASAVSRSSVARAGPPPTSPPDYSVSSAATGGGARHSALVAPPSAGPAPATDVDAIPAAALPQVDTDAASNPSGATRMGRGSFPPEETGLEAGPTTEVEDVVETTAPTGVVWPALSPVWQAWLGGLVAVRDLVLQLPPVPLSIWLGGIALIAMLYAGHTAYFWLSTRRATPAPPHVEREVRLVASALQLRRLPTIQMVPARVSPLVLCGWRPRLILPQQLWQELDPYGRRAILCHELAHLRRRDHWVRWLELAVGLVYWWHPVAWWARRRLNEEADLCCDAWVTWLMPRRRRAYAEALLQTTAYLDGMRVATPAGGMAVTGRGARRIARRITMVMTHTLSPRRSLMSMTLALLLCTGGWLVRPALSCPPKEAPKDAPTQVEPAAPTEPAEPTELTLAPAAVPVGVTVDARAPMVTTANGEFVLVGTGPTATVAAPSAPEPPKPPKPGPRLRWSADGPSGSLPAAQPPVVAMVGEREITRQYKLPEGQREALTKLMLRDDVPIRVRPTEDGIEVRGTPAQQAVFSDFIALLDDRTKEQEYKLPKGKAEALWELMSREDVPVHVAQADNGIQVQGNAAVQRAFGDFVQLIQDGRVAERPRRERGWPALPGMAPAAPGPPVPAMPGTGVFGEVEPGMGGNAMPAPFGVPQREQEARARAQSDRARKLYDAQVARQRARADAQRRRVEVREFEARQRELERTGEGLERQIERLQEQLEKLEQQLQELETKAHDIDATAHPAVMQQHAALEAQRAAVREKVEAAQAQLAALTAQAEAAASEAEEAEASAERADEVLELLADGAQEGAAPELLAELCAQAAQTTQADPCGDAERSAQTLAADALGMAADSLREHAAPQIRDAFQKATAALRGEWREHLKDALRDFDAHVHADGAASATLAGALDEVANGLEGFANGAIEDTLEQVAKTLESKAERLREKATEVPQAEEKAQPAARE